MKPGDEIIPLPASGQEDSSVYFCLWTLINKGESVSQT